MREQRQYDVIVWGASGFTGRLVAACLARHPTRTRWAIAGRNRQKLLALREELGSQLPGFDADALPLLVAESHDLDSLRQLVSQARVVISTVGPYALHGSGLVQACAERGTDYCDLSGELQWIHRMINAWDAKARQSGARLLHCCGFDSIPFDLGNWFLQRAMIEEFGVPATVVRTRVLRMKGSFSGGTFASMLNFIEELAHEPQLRRLAADPDALLPAGAGADSARAQAAPAAVEYDSVLDTWTGPFVMAAINTRIVRRSNALLDFPWGHAFSYEEAIATGAGIGGRLRANALAAGLGAFLLTASGRPGRALLRRLAPDPGEGPSEEQRRRGCYEIAFIGRNPAAGDRWLRIDVRGDCDPGYCSTAKMLTESALCLALDPPRTGGGSWTPAAAMAEPLLRRLQDNAGLTFDVYRQPG